MIALAPQPKVSYAEELARLSAKLCAAPELAALVHTAAFHLRQLLGCSVVIFTKPGSEPLWIAAANVGVPREDLLHVRYERGDDLIARLETGEFVEEGDLPPRAVLVVPVRRRQELIALISLGRTPLGDAFGDSERDLLTAMADQLGLHIENFRLRDQDRELSRVREIQERLLPKSRTGIKGYDVAHV